MKIVFYFYYLSINYLWTWTLFANYYSDHVATHVKKHTVADVYV